MGAWAGDVGDVFAIKKKEKEIKRLGRVHVDPRGCEEAAPLQPAAWPAVKRASGAVIPQVRKPFPFVDRERAQRTSCAVTPRATLTASGHRPATMRKLRAIGWETKHLTAYGGSARIGCLVLAANRRKRGTKVSGWAGPRVCA